MNEYKIKIRQIRIMTEASREAYCESKGCNIPRDTCLSLGTCEDYDKFKHKLEEKFNSLDLD